MRVCFNTNILLFFVVHLKACKETSITPTAAPENANLVVGTTPFLVMNILTLANPMVSYKTCASSSRKEKIRQKDAGRDWIEGRNITAVVREKRKKKKKRKLSKPEVPFAILRTTCVRECTRARVCMRVSFLLYFLNAVASCFMFQRSNILPELNYRLERVLLDSVEGDDSRPLNFLAIGKVCLIRAGTSGETVAIRNRSSSPHRCIHRYAGWRGIAVGTFLTGSFDISREVPAASPRRRERRWSALGRIYSRALRVLTLRVRLTGRNERKDEWRTAGILPRHDTPSRHLPRHQRCANSRLPRDYSPDQVAEVPTPRRDFRRRISSAYPFMAYLHLSGAWEYHPRCLFSSTFVCYLYQFLRIYFYVIDVCMS